MFKGSFSDQRIFEKMAILDIPISIFRSAHGCFVWLFNHNLGGLFRGLFWGGGGEGGKITPLSKIR